MDPVTAALISWATGQAGSAATHGLKRLLVGDKQQNALRAVVEESISVAVDETVTAPDREVVRDALLRDSPETVEISGKDFGDARALVAAQVAPRLEVLHEQGYVIDAELLTHVLVRTVIAGIQADAMHGGPLTPLAEFLRHERIAVAGEQALSELKAMNQALGIVLARVPPGDHVNARLIGEPIAEAGSPVALGVHKAIKAAAGELPELPTYVRRAHDDQLLRRVQELGQRSAMTVLVGNSSTGKTRALWEAVAPLPLPWRLWAPPDAESLHAGLTGSVIGPQTVLWLNDLVNYLDPAQGDMASDNAKMLRNLIDHPTGPVLVLATAWPEHWQLLTAQSRSLDQQASQNSAAAALLAKATYITVPDSFGGSDLESVRAAARHDPRLSAAMENASGGRITQYLAGAPMLLERYDTTPTEARAVIDAAIDARRLGHPAQLPKQLLLDAASGYIDEDTWARLGDDWQAQALRTVTLDWRGLPGPLARIRPRPSEHVGSQPQYRLADVLEQTGGQARRLNVPPEQFWMAVARYCTGDYANTLAIAAEKRGLFRHAVILYQKEIAAGSAPAAISLLRLLDRMGMDTHQPAAWIAQHVSLVNASDITRLLELMQKAGAAEAIGILLTRLPIQDIQIHQNFSWSHFELLRLLIKLGADDSAKALARRFADEISLDEPTSVASLISALHKFGTAEALRALLARDPSAHARLSEPWRAAKLLVQLREAGADNAADALARRLAREVSLDDSSSIADLLKQLRDVGTGDVADALARRLAREVSLDDSSSVADLLSWLRETRADEPVSTLLARDPGAHAPLSEIRSTAKLLVQLREAGADNAADSLAWQLARKGSLDNSSEIGRLVSALCASGPTEALRALLDRDPASHIPATSDLDGIRSFLEALRILPEELHAAGAETGTALASRVAQQFPVDEPRDITKLLVAMNGIPRPAVDLADRAARSMPFSSMDGVTDVLRHLRQRGMRQAIQVLVARDPAQHVPLGSPWSTSKFIQEMCAAGADNAEQRLYCRAAQEVSFDNPWKVAQLLNTLRTTGADEAMGLLLGRDPAEYVSINYARTMPDDDIGDDRAGAAWLLLELRLANVDEAAMMLARRAAQDITFERPNDIAYLLLELAQAKRNYRTEASIASRTAATPGNRDDSSRQRLERLHREAGEAIAILLARGPEREISFTHDGEVNLLYTELRAAGGDQVARALLRNALNAGISSVYLSFPGDKEDLFRYGREPDGTPSSPSTLAKLLNSPGTT